MVLHNKALKLTAPRGGALPQSTLRRRVAAIRRPPAPQLSAADVDGASSDSQEAAKVAHIADVPRLTHPSKRSLIGGLYSATLLFEFCVFVSGEPGDRRLCEERLILVKAPSARKALREATRQGKASAYRYRNVEGNPVHFRFVGVLGLCHLGAECQPNEVWYSIVERLRPMERRQSLVPKPEQLSAIRNEDVLAGKK